MLVLVVDDTVDAADMLAMCVRVLGHRSVVANDGGRALELAREQRPDVILIDIQMPCMDGYETSRRIREDLGLLDARIIAVSGYCPDRLRQQQAGLSDHLMKPINFDQIRMALAV